MAVDHSSERWRDQNDPFGEDFYLVPHDEVIRARIEQIAEDNQDAFRHFVELAIWGALDNPDLHKVLVALLWLWEDVEPRWLAEASFKSVSDVRDLVESQPVMTFNCPDCGAELKPMNRRHLLRMYHSQKALRRDEGDDPPTELLCKTCIAQRADHAEEQRRLDDLRQQAVLADYRGTTGAKLTVKVPSRVVDSMGVREFIEEARYAHDLLSVYLDYRGHNYPALRERAEAPESKLDREFSEAYRLNRKKWGLWTGRGASQEARDGATWLATQCAIGDVVTELVEGVRLRVGIQQMAGPTPSWECPNLLSAIYLQFYWLVTLNKPIRHCEYCGQAFELTREDKNVCGRSCRSGLRYERQKREKGGDTN